MELVKFNESWFFFPEIVNIDRVFCPSMNQIKKKLRKSWDFQGTSPNELYLKSVWKHGANRVSFKFKLYFVKN